jgi:DNA-directed RNA polymerase specialized sigma24 family protein
MTADNRFVLTKDSLDALLARLDPDRTRAGAQYETLRLGLIRFFEWRGATTPVEHADETLDRVARKIGQGEEIRDIHAFVAGVARFVFMEVVKQQNTQQAALRKWPEQPEAEQPAPGPDDGRMGCAKECLKGLPGDQARLLLAYYQDEKARKIANRRGIADELRISPHTLRMRMRRIRVQLEECIMECEKRKSGTM